MTTAATCAPFREEPPERDTYILDHGFRFNPATWRRRLPEAVDLPTWFDDLPRVGRWPRITRADLLQAGAAAHTGRAAIDVLVGAYAWGSGLSSGRSAARLGKIFNLNDDRIDRRLGEALRLLRSDGPVTAYAALGRGGDHRLEGLGPSFFTKLLYFLGWDSAAGDHRPLIMDQYMVIGMNDCRSTSWRPLVPWTADQYGEYLAWAQETANDWGAGTETDVVERAIWEHGKRLSQRT
ncbi:hypothetical protein AB0J94_32030 [Micromonospora noduli]|uniref:8-oxoguanine DNA glycosylase OGG fold protein n=1 Tax=Micromonospora noduli TaxID=709876 RepID=UPI003425D213